MDEVSQIRMIRCDQIVVDDRVQSRVRLDMDAVARYAEIYRDTEEADSLPALVVFQDRPESNQFLLAAGFHRLAGARLAGLAEVPCEVRAGGMIEAILCSVGENATHGVPRTDADKRRAVEMALATWPDWSVLKLRQACKVSWAFADKVAREVVPERFADKAPARELPAGTPSGAKASGGKSKQAAAREPAAEPDDFEPETTNTAAATTEMTITDHFGCPVPPQLRAVFETAAEMRSLKKDAAAVRRRIDALKGRPGANMLNLHETTAHAENAADCLGRATPHVVCPDCDGRKQPCKLCGNHGWLPQARYASLTAKQQRRCERFARRPA